MKHYSAKKHKMNTLLILIFYITMNVVAGVLIISKEYKNDKETQSRYTPGTGLITCLLVFSE